MTTIIDRTTQREFDEILKRMPDNVQPVIAPNIRDIDEIIFDLGELLSVRISDLRIDYPIRVDELMMKKADALISAEIAGGWRLDGRIGIPETLHRISREVNTNNATTQITVRVGRALMGVAEPLREVLYDAVTNKYGIAIIGPPAAGKTTLLRDVARILAERLGRGLVIIDTSNEIAGDSAFKHSIVGKARRITVGNPLLQAEKFARTIGNTGPTALLSDEIGYRDDIPVIVQNAPRGVSITATLHGENMARIVRSQNVWPLLGIKDEKKVEPAIFRVAIEIPRRGFFRVHTNFDKSIESYLSGQAPTEGIQEIYA